MIRVHYPDTPTDIGILTPTTGRDGYVKWGDGCSDEVRRDDSGAWWMEAGDDPTPPEVHFRLASGGWSFLNGVRLVTLMETP